MWTALSAFTNGGATVPLVMLTMFLPVKWMQDSVNFFGNPGAVSIRKTVLPGVAIPMLKIRRPNGRLIFNIGIAIRR